MASKYRVAIIGTGRMGGLIEDEIPLGDPNKPYGHFSAYEYIEETEVIFSIPTFAKTGNVCGVGKVR